MMIRWVASEDASFDGMIVLEAMNRAIKSNFKYLDKLPLQQGRHLEYRVL